MLAYLIVFALIVFIFIGLVLRLIRKTKRSREEAETRSFLESYFKVRRVRWSLFRSRYAMASTQDRGYLLQEDQDAVRLLDIIASSMADEKWGTIDYDL